MEHWTILEILQAGGFIAIMLAVLGVPQLLSSYFDLRARRLDRLENETNAERRHQEMLEARREERREERRVEEERRRQEEERHRVEEERRRMEEERRRQESDLAERRHQELMALILAAVTGNRDQNDAQTELIRSLHQTVAELQAENARLRRQNGDDSAST